MDSFLYGIFLGEIEHQCNFAEIAYDDLINALSSDSRNRVWYSLQSFLIASANLSKIFWPTRQGDQKRGEIRRRLDRTTTISFAYAFLAGNVCY